jgi:Protein of unknown function (DUF3575)
MLNLSLFINIKKQFLFFISVFSVFNIGFSQEIVRKKSLIKADIVSPAYSYLTNAAGYSFSYENQIKNNHGIQLSVDYFSDRNSLESYKTIQLIPQYKYYFNKTYKGYYVGAYIKYTNYHVHKFKLDMYNNFDDSYEFVQQSVAYGALNGYLIYLGKKNRFIVDATIGIGMSTVVKFDYIKKGNYTYKKNRLDGIVAINIGYRLF